MISIISINPLAVGAAASPEAVAFVTAFNFAFNVIVTLTVYMLPAVAAIRLVQRS